MPSPKHHKRSSTASQHSATGAAIRRGDIKISDPIPIETGFTGPPPAFDMSSLAPDAHPQETSRSSRKVSPSESQLRARNISTGQGEMIQVLRASAGPSLVPSSVSVHPSKTSLTQRKNSGIRATLKRMFGSVSKRNRTSFIDRKEYHQSDPGKLISIVEKKNDARVTQPATQRSSSVSRGNPLGSHPQPDPGTMPRTSLERNRLKSPRRPRRNTLPSVILTDHEAQTISAPTEDFHAGQWRQREPTDAQLKRRSRSADALNDLVASYGLHHDSAGDLESQKAYWRTSIVANPPPVWHDNQQVEQQQDSKQERDTLKLEPIQTFDFGLTKPEDREPISLEDRVNTLEIKLFDFEFAIAKLQGNDIPKPMLYPKPPKRRSIHELFPQSDSKSASASSLSGPYEPTSFLTSPDESPIPSTEQEETFRPDRSSKATTIRPLTARRQSGRRSTAPSPSPARISPEQFDALMEMLKQEQSARKRLETQVADLQREVEALRMPVYAEIREITYPTPSPESAHETPLGHRQLHRSPRFGYEKTPQETSRFSMSELDTDTEDGFQDVYETPQENRFRFESRTGSPLVGVS